jgi:hypothetical protein
MITILAATKPKVITKEKLLSTMQAEGDVHSPDSVEKKATLVPIDVKNGYGAYYVLTDARLVGKTPAQDEYKVMARFIIQYENNALASITAFMDDANCTEFKQILESIFTMEPIRESLSHII